MGKIVLDLDREDVSVEQFTEAFRLQVRLAEEVMKERGVQVDEVRWVVSDLRSGSAHATATPQLTGKNVFMADVDAAIDASGRGVNDLAKSATRPKDFNDDALKLSRRLIEIVKEADHGKARLTFGKVKVAPSSSVTAHVAALMKEEIQGIGSIEGQLFGVEGSDGTYKISIKDQRRNRKIPCIIHDKAQLTRALASFEKRVIIRGVVWAREDGTPVKIEVRSLEAIPADDELPTREQVRGILKDFRRADAE
jgi:hypothetical protein